MKQLQGKMALIFLAPWIALCPVSAQTSPLPVRKSAAIITKTAAKSPKSVNPTSQKNVKLGYDAVAIQKFKGSEFDKAVSFASAALRQNPADERMKIILARSYYRLGNSGRAAKFFATLDLNRLSGDEVLEYTLAMFAAKKYKLSSRAWVLIPDTNPSKDTAKFYAGVSYMYLRIYPKASVLLRSARNVPQNLRVDRRRLIDEVDELLDRERRGQFAQDRTYAYQTQRYVYQPPYLPAQAPVLAPGPASNSVEKKPVPPTPALSPAPPPKEGFSASFTPSVSYELTAQKIDRNGYITEQADSKTPSASFPTSIKYSGKPRSFGGQPSFTLNLTPGYDDTEVSKSSSELTAPEDNPDAVQNQITTSAEHSFNLTLGANVELNYPVSDPIGLIVGFKNDHKYVDASSKKDVSKTGPNAKVTIEGDTVKGDLSFSMIDKEDAANRELGVATKIDSTMTYAGSVTRSGDTSVSKLEVSQSEVTAESKQGLKSTLSVKGNYDKTLGDFGLGLSGNYSSREAYPESVIPVGSQTPKSDQTLGASVKWSLDFGISMTGGISYSQFNGLEFLLASEETPTIYASDGTLIVYNLLVSAPIFGSYGGIEASYKYSDRAIKTPDEIAGTETETTILKTFWSQITTSSVKLSLKYPF